MTRASAVLGVLLVLAACGDNQPGADDGVDPGACAPATPPELPTKGPLRDPLALDLGACIEGGLANIEGRWFQRGDTRFDFSYPRFSGSCETGFSRSNARDEDHDETDNDSFFVWTDGTRYWERSHFEFNFDGSQYEVAFVTAACMHENDQLAVVRGYYDSDFGEEVAPPTLATRFAPKEEGHKNITLVYEEPMPNPALQVAVDGNYAFTAGPRGVISYDVTDPASAQRIGYGEASCNDVKLVHAGGKTVAYCAPYDGETTKIFDVSDPSNPLALGVLSAYSHSIFITEDTTPPRMYLGNYSESVPIYDISAPLTPVLIGNVALPHGTPPDNEVDDVGVHDIHVDGTRIYADKTTTGLVAVDIANGIDAPTVLGGFPTSYSHATWAGMAGGRKIAIHGDEGMVPFSDEAAFMRVVDADETSPTFMQEIGRYASRKEVGIHNMILKDGLAYIAYYQDGIRIVDLSDPTNPVEVAHYNTFDNDTAPGESFEGAVGLAVVDDLIYVADSLKGFMILRYTP